MGFYDNFVMLCNKVGKKPSKVALEIGISKSIVSRWKSGGGATDATARKVADYFGVPVSELTGTVRKPMTVDALAGDVSIADTVWEMVHGKNKKPAGQQANEHRDPLMEPEILFALFGNSDNITPEMMEDVKRFARYVQQEKERQGK